MDFIWHSLTSGVEEQSPRGILKKHLSCVMQDNDNDKDNDNDNDKGYLEKVSLLGCAMHSYNMHKNVHNVWTIFIAVSLFCHACI